MIVSDKGSYVGSTVQKLRRRHKTHIASARNPIGRHCTSSTIAEGSKIVLLEKYPCKTREELLQREKEWMLSIECVNKVRPNRSPEELKEQQDNYRNINKDRLNEYRRGWRKFKSSWGYNNYLGTSLNLLDIQEDVFQ